MANWVKTDPNRKPTTEFNVLTQDQLCAAIPMMFKTGTLECVYSEKGARLFPAALLIIGFLVMAGLGLLAAWKIGWI
jgi:hypothetical protein